MPKSVIQPSSQHLFDVNLRYLYALRQIPQHVFTKFMLARQVHFATAASANVPAKMTHFARLMATDTLAICKHEWVS